LRETGADDEILDHIHAGEHLARPGLLQWIVAILIWQTSKAIEITG
jgi:hypothetical protein